MALKIRAIYENGQIKLLNPVELHEGQELTVNVEQVSERDAVCAALGDLVQWSDPTYGEDAWVEDLADEIAEAFRGLRPLSEIIIEERNSGW
jgi:predicted DNA-binding antitoxin AbrB/MazE fold protein